MVPMLAVLLTILYGGPFSRNPRRYFLEHLIFALHAYGWWLLWILFILALMAAQFVSHLISANRLDTLATLLEFPGLGVYTFLASRRYYRGNLLAAVARGIILTFGVYGIFVLYRFMLLFTILRAL